MLDPDRHTLEGIAEVDQAEIPFRVGDTLFFDPGKSGYQLIAGTLEAIDRDTNLAKPRRMKANTPLRPHPLHHDRGQFRSTDRSLREGRCAARNNCRASYPGLTGYRHRATNPS